MHYPSLAQVKELAGEANLAPICREVAADLETPVSAYLKVARGEHSFLLESVEGGERLARFSFIGTEPYRVVRLGPYGDPTEGALLVAATKAGMNKEKLEKAFPRLDEIPFQSEKQYMATLHPRDGGRVAYVKGSVEKILALSKFKLKGEQVVPLTEKDADIIMQANTDMAGQALRVIATAYAEHPSELEDLKDEHIRGNHSQRAQQVR